MASEDKALMLDHSGVMDHEAPNFTPILPRGIFSPPGHRFSLLSCVVGGIRWVTSSLSTIARRASEPRNPDILTLVGTIDVILEAETCGLDERILKSGRLRTLKF